MRRHVVACPLRVTSAVQVAVIASAATTMITPMMMLRIRLSRCLGSGCRGHRCARFTTVPCVPVRRATASST